MGKTTTTRYDIAEHLRTPEDMAKLLLGGPCQFPQAAVGAAHGIGSAQRASFMRPAGSAIQAVAFACCPVMSISTP